MYKKGENKMAFYEITFSPTGGTKKVSGLFTEAYGAESTYIDLTDRTVDFAAYSFQEEDICAVSVPSYGGRVPAVAVSRLGQLKGNGAKVVLIAVYGNRDYDDTFAELQDTLQTAGFVCIAGIAAIAEHSIMRQFAAGRPDEQDGKELAEFAARVRCAVEAGTVPAGPELPGNRPYRAYGGVPMKPKAGKDCVRCGYCAGKCPVGAIPADNPSKTDPEKCISCMRCIAVCPQRARSVSRALLTAGSMGLKKACSGHKENELFLP